MQPREDQSYSDPGCITVKLCKIVSFDTRKICNAGLDVTTISEKILFTFEQHLVGTYQSTGIGPLSTVDRVLG